MPLPSLHSGLSLRRRQDPLGAYAPTEEQIQQQTQEQDKPALLWRLLGIPERLLGGQMIKGFAEGLGRGGISEGLWEGFRNNPLAQILEALPGVDGIVQDTSFAKVREAWGDTDTEEGAGNFVLNTAGDILMSPFELMFNPFGRLVSAGAKASAVAKGEANIGKAAFSVLARGGPAALADAVVPNSSGIRRMLFAFKVPFTETGFAFAAPKNMDLHIAKLVDGAATWLNTNPATVAVLDLFTRAKLRVGDATARAFGAEARTAAENVKRAQSLQFARGLHTAIREARSKGLTLSTDQSIVVQFLSDYGLDKIDADFGNVYRALDLGPEASHAAARTRSLLDPVAPSSLLDDDALGKARDIAKRLGGSDAADVEKALTEWQAMFPDAAVPETLRLSPHYDAMKPKLRERIDIAPGDYVPQDVRVADIVGEPIVGEDGRTIMPGLRDGGFEERGAAALTGEAMTAAQKARGDFKRSIKDIFTEIANKDGYSTLQKLAEFKATIEHLGTRFGMAERTAGILNQSLEPYIMRDLNPEVRDMLGAQLSKVTEGRVSKDSSVLELNMWIHRFGSKLTNYRPVSALEGVSGHASVSEVLAKIFPEEFMGKVKKAAVAGDTRFEELASALIVNPVYSVYKRAEKSLRMLERATFIGAIHDVDGPLVQAETKMSDLVKNDEQAKKQNVGVVYDKNAPLNQQQMARGQHVVDGLNASNEAKRVEFQNMMPDHIQHVVDTVAGRVGPQQGPVHVIDRTLTVIEQASRLDANDLDAAAKGAKNLVPDELSGHPLIKELETIRDLTEQVGDTTKKGTVGFEPVVTEGATLRGKVQGGDTGSTLPEDYVLEQKKPLDHPVTEPVEAQMYNEVQTINDRPGRKVKKIPLTEEYLQETMDHHRSRYFEQDRDLEIRLNQRLDNLRFWETKLQQLEDGVAVHEPMGAQGKGSLTDRNATQQVSHPFDLEAKEMTVEEAAAAAKDEAKQAKKSLRGKATEVRGAKRTLEERGAKLEARARKYEIKAQDLVESPKTTRKLLDRAQKAQEKIYALRNELDSTVAGANDAASTFAAKREVLDQAEAELKAVREELKQASKPLDDIRKNVAEQWRSADADQKALFAEREAYKKGTEQLDSFDEHMIQAEDDAAAAGVILSQEDRDKIAQQFVKGNPFLRNVVTERWLFDMSARKGAVEKASVNARYWKDSFSQSHKVWRKWRGELADTVKRTLIGRGKDAVAVLTDKLHGSDVVTEFQIALEQSKTGSLPLQNLDALFERRAAVLNSKPSMATTPVTAADLRLRWEQAHPDATIHWFQPDVHEAIYGRNGMLDRMYSPTALANMFQRFGLATSWWKATTVLPPIYLKSRIRDVLTSVLSVAQGTGTMPNPEDWRDAYRTQRTIGDYMRGITDADKESVHLGAAGQVTLADVIQSGTKNGVLSPGGYVRDELAMVYHEIPGAPKFGAQGESVASRLLHTNPAETWWGRPGAKLAEFGDNMAKVSAALSFARKKGVDLDTAFTAIKRWVYDPGSMDLSNAERYLFSKFIPFYKYTKYAVGSQVDAFLARPASVTWFEKAHANSARAQGMSDVELNSFMPEFIQTNLGVPVKKRPDGLQVQLFGSFLPLGEVTRLAQTITDSFDPEKKSGIKDWFGANMNPFLRIPVEQALNRSFFTQRPITQFPGQRGEMFGVSMPMQMRNVLTSIRLLNELDNLNAVNFGDVSSFLAEKGAVSRRQYAETSFLERLWGTSLLPIPSGRPYFLSGEQQLRMKLGQYEQEQSSLKHQLRLQVERGNPATSDENTKQITELLAASIARQRAAISAASKLGATPEQLKAKERAKRMEQRR